MEAGAPPPSGGARRGRDLTGYWSVGVEDWKDRMVTPKKGVYDTLTLNPEGRRVGDAWDPAKDEAAGEQCRAYGAANIMRLPGRLHITWQDANTLKVETDTGTQTRLFQFGAPPAPGEPSWQGQSVAQWEMAAGARGGAARGGSLKVVTTNLRPGYVRKNGAPYSAKAVVNEHFDINTMPNNDQWLTVTTEVLDPVYFTRHYAHHHRLQETPTPTDSGPPCSAMRPGCLRLALAVLLAVTLGSDRRTTRRFAALQSGNARAERSPPKTGLNPSTPRGRTPAMAALYSRRR